MIALTHQAGSTIYVNPSQVVAVFPADDGSRVQLANNTAVVVQESPYEVYRQIEAVCG